MPPAAINTGVDRNGHEGLQPRLGQSTCPLPLPPQMYKSRQLDLGERGRGKKVGSSWSWGCVVVEEEADRVQVGMEGGDYSCSLALHQSECASK